ncbi:HAD-IA family hydrolase [Hazenella sp. IB182357]|uniref:HAD-IA family hydrolase n=1 Tax=Polycladospora coralii TaxID=2771432 RepID=A0A926RUI6_9BACL|nr:HAD-IA family hydrolase [Polycladospora coralii]MBS7531406.1 HAD-IA family hydrolase [Polycladospora coralii]
MKAILFDLDGTLFQTEKVAVPAFLDTFQWLITEGLYDGEIPDERKIESAFGLTHDEIWDLLLPNCDEDVRARADQIMLQAELERFDRDLGVLYPGVGELLHHLYQKKLPLFIASNGSPDYVYAALKSKKLVSLFTGIYTAGGYQTKEKVDLVKIAMTEHGITDGYMVGDRNSDIKAGKENGLITVGCRYTGFSLFGEAHELDHADHIINHPNELLSLL